MREDPKKLASVRAYLETRDEMERAEQNIERAMECVYPLGTTVTWEHGRQCRSGVVVGYQWRGCNLLYHNPRTGKNSFVYVGSVIGYDLDCDSHRELEMLVGYVRPSATTRAGAGEGPTDE